MSQNILLWKAEMGNRSRRSPDCTVDIVMVSELVISFPHYNALRAVIVCRSINMHSKRAPSLRTVSMSDPADNLLR